MIEILIPFIILSVFILIVCLISFEKNQIKQALWIFVMFWLVMFAIIIIPFIWAKDIVKEAFKKEAKGRGH